MTRIFFLVTLYFSFAIVLTGQCPTLNLSSTSGSTCGTTPVTISGNTFDNATKVTIREDGDGSINDDSLNDSPFSFTYTPRSGDIGNTVTITVSTNNPKGSCDAAIETFTLSVLEAHSAPQVRSTTQPTCQVSTGSVLLEGLPNEGEWTLTRMPGNVVTKGTGTTALISNLSPGIYNFTVANSGCISPSSASVVISGTFTNPTAPVIGSINRPTCSVSTASVNISGLPSDGWTLTRFPGNIATSGTGASTTLVNIPSGTYTYTVTNISGCVSPMSGSVVIPSSPPLPSPPLIGTITQPNYASPTGSVVVNGLPDTGTWTLALTPGNVIATGTGISTTITGLAPGVYNFRVTNSSGCTSGLSANFEINNVSGPPLVKISNPLPVCSPSTVDITASSITAGSTAGLTYSYWTDANAVNPYLTPEAATSGTYYIKGTTEDGFFTIKPVIVTTYNKPVADAGRDQSLTYSFNTKLEAMPVLSYETGEWKLTKGTGLITDKTNAGTAVTGLSLGKNSFLWTVTNDVCPPSSDSVIINVLDFAIPTLITPNNDGNNDFMIIKRPEDLQSKVDLVIFDRRGLEVYKNSNYDNSWNGVDMNGNQLPDDTYFYVMKSSKGTFARGFIVIRR